MTKSFWDERYASKEYIYGKTPNNFFKAQLDLIPNRGSILLPCEGEGRNAIYAAKNGWEVSAFDFSEEGQKKALNLAQINAVTIEYKVCGFTEFYPTKKFDVIALLYAHINAADRKLYHQKCVQWLNPGGTIILEGFTKEQLGLNSGGPKDLDMLFSLEGLKTEFMGLEFEILKNEKTILSEGPFHRGEAFVIRMKGVKRRL